MSRQRQSSLHLVDDQSIRTFLDVDPVARRVHVAACRPCQRRVELFLQREYAPLQPVMAAFLEHYPRHRSLCPSPEDLRARRDDVVRTHLAWCELCQSERKVLLGKRIPVPPAEVERVVAAVHRRLAQEKKRGHRPSR